MTHSVDINGLKSDSFLMELSAAQHKARNRDIISPEPLVIAEQLSFEVDQVSSFR